ncbi:MAG TPA: metallophosphoesterase, partial [Polyangiaceae bacterium LLY-WYZ-15_(1-7)]|nr:metallophosphoesterase [Polyangiaceae bacterium LLY-WYZ-15_(1-7)]
PSRRDFQRQFRVRRFAGPSAHAETLDGLRIVHLTDMHVGRVTPVEAQLEAVRITNAAEPDAVVITGDFVCHSHAFLDELTFVVSAIDAPVFAVLGNHDYWSGDAEVRWALRRADAEILDNVWTTITLRHQELQVVGLDDAYTGHARWREATKGLRRDKTSLGLSHIAEEADALWSRGVPLVLSGHTHAGQVTVAKIHELAVGRLAGHKYVHGLYGRRAPDGDDEPQGAVYVGAGVGAAVMPLRIGERSRREVTIFELGHAPGAFEEPHDEQEPAPGRKPSEKTKLKRIQQVEKKRLKRQRKRRKNGSHDPRE